MIGAGPRLLGLIAAVSVLSCGPGPSPSPAGSPPGQIHGSGAVNVMFAGSLTVLFERRLGPGFEAATGFRYQGEGKGSVAIANLMRDRLKSPDVFVSADPDVNRSLQGPANGDLVSWWVRFARTELVIAWSPRSRLAADFEAARAGRRSWESVLGQSGVRLGRTDPDLDPKGYRTLFLFQLDEQRTGDAGELQRILGATDNPRQLFPEEQLVARLQAGELDAGIFYTIEAVEAGLPFLTLPAAVNQGDPGLAEHYARVTYTNRRGQLFRGSPIAYTIAIPSTSRNPPGAQAFVQYVLGAEGRALLARGGLLPVEGSVSGDPTRVPPALRPILKM